MNSNSHLHQDVMPRIDKPHQAGQNASHEQEELGPKLHSLPLTTESPNFSVFSIATDFWEHRPNLELWFLKSHQTRWSLELSSMKSRMVLWSMWYYA